MLTFTFAGDESGDASFNFVRGASRYFVVNVIGTQNPDALRDLLSHIRQQAYLPKSFDFHFNSLASAKLRNLLFKSLGQADFEAWAIIVDKTTLPDALKILVPGLNFYLYFVSELIRQNVVHKASHLSKLLTWWLELYYAVMLTGRVKLMT